MTIQRSVANLHLLLLTKRTKAGHPSNYKVITQFLSIKVTVYSNDFYLKVMIVVVIYYYYFLNTF